MPSPTPLPSPAEPPKAEEQRAGIDFVDILFALVVGEALDALTRTPTMSVAGRSHLAFAGLLTIMSWIGYHNSPRRYSNKIVFVFRNPRRLTALGKFLVDVGLVVIYWIAVRTTEGGFSGSAIAPSWRSSVVVALLSFMLYVLWDLLSWLSPRSNDRPPKSRYLAWRRSISWIFLVLVVALSVGAWSSDPKSSWSVAFVNIGLCVVVVAYRFAKDLNT